MNYPGKIKKKMQISLMSIHLSPNYPGNLKRRTTYLLMWSLKSPPDDHVKSIWFIEQLAGLKVDKNRLSIIEKDIKKVIKGTEIYGI